MFRHSLFQERKHLCWEVIGCELSTDLVNDWYPDSTSNRNQIDEYY